MVHFFDSLIHIDAVSARWLRYVLLADRAKVNVADAEDGHDGVHVECSTFVACWRGLGFGLAASLLIRIQMRRAMAELILSFLI